MRCHACLSLEVLTDTAEVELASWEFAVCIEIIHMSMYIDQAIFVGSFLLSNCMGLMIDTCRAHCRVHTYTADVKLEFAVYVYTCIMVIQEYMQSVIVGHTKWLFISLHGLDNSNHAGHWSCYVSTCMYNNIII